MIQAVRQTGESENAKGRKAHAGGSAEPDRMGENGRSVAEVKAASAHRCSARSRSSPKQRSFLVVSADQNARDPPVKDVHWPKTNIDRLVLAKLEARELRQRLAADRRTLIRRATFDLTGLPPTPEEIDAFEKDKSPNAFAKVVDRLLASPRYGERWGRHWLDVARYAEDDVRGLDPKGRGYMPFRGAYVYRDWVIKAVNDDLPYDKFVRWQLAGDLSGEKNVRDALPGHRFPRWRSVAVGPGGAGAGPRG